MSANTEISRSPLGLIGLGLVGSALMERFTAAGMRVTGFDIDSERCREFRDRGGLIADSPRSVVERTRTVVLSLPDSTAVEAVIAGNDGILSSGEPDITILDTTTGDPFRTVEIANQITASQCHYVDACILGSSQQVADADAVVIAGGSTEDMDRCRDILDTFAREIFHMGPAGKGCEAKLVVNLVLGLNRLVLSEGLVLAEALDCDTGTMLELLRSGAAYSRVMDTKGEKMLSRDFEPQARLSQHLKDVMLILELGRHAGVQLPASELHRRLLSAGAEAGLGSLDNSAIIEVLRKGFLNDV